MFRVPPSTLARIRSLGTAMTRYTSGVYPYCILFQNCCDNFRSSVYRMVLVVADSPDESRPRKLCLSDSAGAAFRFTCTWICVL